jgi:ElaA protein
MKFLCLSFDELSTAQLYEVLRLRSEVFVVEQTCIYQDMDNKDIQSGVRHLLMLDDTKLVGYARLLPHKVSFDTPSIGRILIAPTARDKGLGRILIQAALEHTFALWPDTDITIGAQKHLSDLYRSFGFVEISEQYLEDGILHVDMRIKH